jgi:glucose/arabinose dehydrogenase
MKIGFKVITAGILLTLSTAFIDGAGINLPKSPPIYGYGLTNLFPGVNFAQPVAIATPPGETNSLYIAERLGRIIVIPDLTRPEPKVFLDVRETTDGSDGEAGLLGIAFHPDYKTNGRFFVFRIQHLSENYCDTLSEFKRDLRNPVVADPSSEKILLAQADANSTHNAGDIHFGPDGYLYVSAGYDGPAQRQKPQAIDEGLFGGILRIDVDSLPTSLLPNAHPASTEHYRIPPDNPFVAATQFNGATVDPAKVQTEFYAVGLRNPWRFTFHPTTGELICGDVGEGSWEEINIVKRGKNYGWPFLEGRSLSLLTNAPRGLVSPVYEYAHGSGMFEGSAIIGGLVYTGSNLPDLRGKYLFGDTRRGHIWAIDLTQTNPPAWLTATAGISTFGYDPRDKEVLVANVAKGSINKLVYSAPEASGIPKRLSAVNAFANLATLEARAATEYEIISPFWSDGATKRRWINLENASDLLHFKAAEPWGVPPGTIFIKHFDLEMTNGVPASRRRLETRFLVHSTNGFYGLTYRWNALGTDAELVHPSGLTENLEINEGGLSRAQKWYFPGWEQCALCHNQSGTVLGVNTHQLNRFIARPDGQTNQLDWMRQHALFNNPDDVRTETLPRFSALEDTSAPLQHRVRSYLASNCAQCHQPGGTSGMNWDARISTPVENAKIIDAPSAWYPDPEVKIIASRSVNYSFMYHRLYHDIESLRMPPVASVRADHAFVNLLTNWISAIPEQAWASKNIGAALLEGSAEQDGRSFRLSSSGPGIQQDGVFFLSKEAIGKVEFAALLSDFKVRAGEAGIMLRDSENPDSAYAAIYINGTDLIFRLRHSTGSQSKIIAKAPARLISWISLSRKGGEVTARFKNSAGEWLELATGTSDLRSDLRAGFFTASGQVPARFVTAKFSDYSLRALDISTAQNGPVDRKISIYALEDDPAVIGQLLLESSTDMKFWIPAEATVSGSNGDILTATHPIENQQLKFFRVRRKN